MGWPVILLVYEAGLVVLVLGHYLNSLTAFSWGALGAVIALFVLSTVDLVVAINKAHKRQRYAALPGRLPLQERWEPLSWVLAPIGFAVGLFLGHQYW